MNRSRPAAFYILRQNDKCDAFWVEKAGAVWYNGIADSMTLKVQKREKILLGISYFDENSRRASAFFGRKGRMGGRMQEGKKHSVCAVVVTYNRLELLKQCVEALRGQSAGCDILIVDNASTDGTAQWAAGQRGCRYRNTGSNLGGAGGFNRGMRWAVEAGYEFVWVMDDDTLPEPQALEKLLEADRALGGNYGWLSSVALWTDGLICPMNLQRTSPYKDVNIGRGANQVIPVQMASFVSLFLRKCKVQKYGLPIQDFFVWVDDWEYTRRISRKELCYLVSDSIVVHAMKNKSTVCIATEDGERLDRYNYFYRNDVYLYRREGMLGWLWVTSKDIWHSMQVLLRARSDKMKRLKTIWNGFWSGVTYWPLVEHNLCIENDNRREEGVSK